MPLTERNLNLPRRTPPTQKTSTPSSKLPRRVPTLSSNPTMSTPVSSSTNRARPTFKSIRSAQPVTSDENRLPSSTLQKNNTSTQSVSVNKPLPREKPLPSRPILRLSSTLSPSKDGRSLIDASEELYYLGGHSVAGEKWPSLTPDSTNPIRAPSTDSSTDTKQSQPSPADSPSRAARASLTNAASTLRNVITGRLVTREHRKLSNSESSASSYASASDGESPTRSDHAPALSIRKTRDNEILPSMSYGDVEPTAVCLDYPTRTASLRNRISTGSLVTPAGSSQRFMGFTDFTRARAPSLTSLDSRQHSPSPASFSRPRPGSLAHSNSKSIRTASRIPVPDVKKATVVDVKRTRLSESSTPGSSAAPSFGSRRLASPEALKILENGKMRRQLKRMPREADVSGAHVDRTWTPDSSATLFTTETPSLSHSLDHSPEGSLAPTSPALGLDGHQSTITDEACDGQDRMLPQQGQDDLAKNEASADRALQDGFSDEDEHFATPLHESRPPPVSPFTMPLQTIPSQAVLDVDDIYNNDEARSELTHTLSRLEGNGSPPKTDVDQQTLMTLFGHLKRGLEKKNRNSTTLSEGAAAAERYLAQHGSVAPDVEIKQDVSVSEKYLSTIKSKSESPCTGKRKQTMVSKWSDSTPSDKGISPIAAGVAAEPRMVALGSSELSNVDEPRPDHRLSIGYPSCMPMISATESLSGPSARHPTEDDPPHVKSVRGTTVSRRQSSPTLGKNPKPKQTQGSVRAAREGMKGSYPSFARTTLAAESKKATRNPTPNASIFSIPEDEARGRASPTQQAKSRREADGPANQAPRSRSKSRIVLDKINGLFSGKRDRKDSDIPPLPAIDTSKMSTDTPMPSNDDETVAVENPSKLPRLPKMPSMSPSTRNALRSSASQATIRTEDTAAVDSFSDSQSVQNLSEHILGKAKREADPQRKERLLNFAKVLNDSLISAREAQISAETAQHAAKNAQMSYEMTQQSLIMLQRLAASMTRARHFNKH